MYLILIIGHTGQGKTPYVNRLLCNRHLPPRPPEVKGKYTTTARSANQYIFDVNNEYILPDDRKMIFPKMRHIDGSIKEFILKAGKLKKTNIVIEDATGFLEGRQSENFRQMITAKMFTQNNYIILFHAISLVPPFMMRLANTVVLFKTVENASEIQKKFGNENLTNAFLTLQKEKKYSYREVKLI